MSSMSLPRVGAVVSLLLLSVLAFPVEAQTPAFEVTSTTGATFLIDANTKSFGITVRNNHATADIEQVDFSFTPTAGAPDPISLTVATGTGWTTTGAVDTDSDGQNDKITMTGGPIAAAGGTASFTVEFNIPTGTADNTQVVLKVAGTDTTPADPEPDVLIGSQNVAIDLQAAGFRFTDTSVVAFATETGSVVRKLVLDAPPRESVTIGLVSSAPSVATVTASLTFTTANWATPQDVTITAVQDNIDGPGRTATITASHTSGASYAAAPSASLSVTVADDDTAAIVVSQLDSSGVGVDGITAAYEGLPGDLISVTLATTPTAQTKVLVTLDTPSQATISPATLTFAANVVPTAQLVTVTAIDDADGNELLATPISITFAVDDANAATEYTTVPDVTINGHVIDNEGVGMTIVQSGGETTVSEAAGARTDTFTVVLNREPHKSVVVKAVAAQAGQTTPEISVLPPQLIFSPTNWNVPQTVTVTAIDDQLPEPTEVATVAISIDKASSSGDYHGVPTQTVTVSILDNDQAGFAVIETGDATITSEDGTSDTVSVQLTTQPSSSVIIQVTTTDADEVLVAGPPGGQLTFTTANWNTPQIVTLTGKDDADADGHQFVAVDFAVVAASSDANWRGLPVQTIQVMNKDNEAVVMARPTDLDVLEGESAPYEVSLTIKPASDVTVTITPGGGLQTSAGSLVFTPANWDTPRVITVTVPDDAVAEGDRTVNIKHSVLGQGNYAGAPGETLVVRVEDDDKIDIAAQNEALQKTVKVSRSDSRNTITWDISVVEGAPLGVQLWRGDSPFFIIANADNGTAAYRLGKYTDSGGGTSSRYVVTVFYGNDAESGFHARGKSTLDQVAGYVGRSESDLEDVGESVPDEDSNALLIAGTIIGLLVVIAIIVVIVILARRKKDEDEWDSDWGETPSSGAEAEKAAPGWDAPAWGSSAASAPSSDAADAWSDEPDVDAGWDADEAAATVAWPDHEDVPLKTFHLTCPQCSHDFSVQGHKPLETECPNCGVTGVLR